MAMQLLEMFQRVLKKNRISFLHGGIASGRDKDHVVHKGGYHGGWGGKHMDSTKILQKLADLRLTSSDNSNLCSPCNPEYFEYTQKVAIVSIQQDKNVRPSLPRKRKMPRPPPSVF